jgi:hypothetical protein
MAKRPKSSHDDFLASASDEARRLLLGRRITEVRYLTNEECQRLMWSFSVVALVLDDGTTVYPARDAEGNDGGALHGVAGNGKEFVLPEVLCRRS